MTRNSGGLDIVHSDDAEFRVSTTTFAGKSGGVKFNLAEILISPVCYS